MEFWKKIFGSRKEIKKLKSLYAEQLKSKDQEIDELKKENQLLIKNAMEQSRKRQEMEEKCKKVLKRLKKH